MNINFDQVITDLDGKSVKERTINEDGDRAPDREMTLGRVCVNALLMPTDEKLDGGERVVRFELAKKLYVGGEIDLETEEIAKIKRLIAKVYSTLITGRSFDLLENKQ